MLLGDFGHELDLPRRSTDPIAASLELPPPFICEYRQNDMSLGGKIQARGEKSFSILNFGSDPVCSIPFVAAYMLLTGE